MAYVLGYRGRHIIIWFLTLILSISWWQCGGFTFIAFVVSILDKVIMKNEYLQDYQARERKEFELFRRKILSHELDPDERYPSLQRLGNNVPQPIVLVACRTYLFDKERIWSQIPFAGTLLIPLSAYDKDHMLNGCGFEVNDIPELIRLAKEERRVRFGLGDPPEYFENMEHFEPIFKEFESPELLYMPYEASSTDLKIIRNFEEEFEALASVSFYNS